MKVIKDYLDGVTVGHTDQELVGVWSCLSNSLQVFTQKVSGAQPGVYKKEELKQFLEKYFLNNTPIPDDLMAGTMQLKCSLLGGTNDVITLSEITKAQGFIQIVSDQSILLRPYMPLTVTHVKTMDQVTLTSAISALNTAGNALAAPLQATGNSYLFSDLIQLLQGYELLAPATTTQIHSFKSQLPVFEAAKTLLLGSQGDRIEGGEWKTFFASAAKWYGIYLRFENLEASESDWTVGPGRVLFVSGLLDVADLLDDSISLQSSSGAVISFDAIDAFVDSFYASVANGVVSMPDGFKNVQAATLKTTMRPMFRRFLGGSDTTSTGRQAAGLGHAALDRARYWIKHWSAGQDYLERLYSHAASETPNATVDSLFSSAALNQYTIEQVMGLKAGTSASQLDAVTLGAISDMRALIGRVRPIYSTQSLDMYFTGYSLNDDRSLYDLSQLNWMYDAARIIVQGYADDPARSQNLTGVTLNEFAGLYEDVKDFLVELNVADPTAVAVAQKRFRESSLFTFNARGSDIGDVDQGAQLLAFMVSGKQQSSRIRASISKKCTLGPLDVFGNPTIEPKCFRSEFDRQFALSFGQMPNLVAYYKNLGVAAQATFMSNLEKATRRSGLSTDWFDTNDVDAMCMLFHYMEAMYERFDENNSQTFDYYSEYQYPDRNSTEIRGAYPVFKQTLVKLSQFTDDRQLKSLFSYILQNGEPPEHTLMGAWNWTVWQHKYDQWDVHADRGRLLQIFGMINQY